MDYKYIFFDLDGTLTDSALGITNSVKFALSSIGIEENDMAKLLKFVGPPLSEGFKTYGDFDDEKIDFLIKKYRERFSVTGIYENSVYDGINELLDNLKKSGKKLIITTSKPTKFTNIILEYFDLKKYFDYIFGSTFDGKVSTKGQVIELAINSISIKNKWEIVMIGDRFYDVIGAKENGINCIGVTYGYGSEEELRSYGAIKTVNSVKELNDLLMSF